MGNLFSNHNQHINNGSYSESEKITNDTYYSESEKITDDIIDFTMQYLHTDFVKGFKCKKSIGSAIEIHMHPKSKMVFVVSYSIDLFEKTKQLFVKNIDVYFFKPISGMFKVDNPYQMSKAINGIKLKILPNETHKKQAILRVTTYIGSFDEPIKRASCVNFYKDFLSYKQCVDNQILSNLTNPTSLYVIAEPINELDVIPPALVVCTSVKNVK